MNHLILQILLLTILIVSGCELNPIEPFSITGIYRRDFVYDEDIIKWAVADLDDFKTEYSFEELHHIISTVNEDLVKKHRSIIVDDDLIYGNIYSLTYYSYDILEGIVESVNPERSSEYGLIETVTVLEVSKSYKTNVELGEITIRDIGGCIDSLCTIDIHGLQPEYQVNERVLVFVQKWESTYYTYGRAQGKFTVIPVDDELILNS